MCVCVCVCVFTKFIILIIFDKIIMLIIFYKKHDLLQKKYKKYSINFLH